MFQNFRAGYAALFRDVSDENHRNSRLLGKLQDGSSTFTYLRNASGRRFECIVVDGLNGIDDYKLRRRVFDVLKYFVEIGFAQNQTTLIANANSIGTQLQLPRTFFTGDIQCAKVVQLQHRLQNERRFSNSRLSSDKCYRCRNKSSPQHTIQFAVAQIDAGLFLSLHRNKWNRLAFYANKGTRVFGRSCSIFSDQFFHKGSPLATRWTFTHPFWRFVTTIIAKINRFEFCHPNSSEIQKIVLFFYKDKDYQPHQNNFVILHP
ncbi:MAG: hypothetical protein BWZ06_01450 [Bacteroidetes bacterium ADurb.BinA261]|nr:MAG: hypothetical protein BWZ06_01450 [Bacteroidetes bacterium ADurb.BinA261]